jgi:hypothetical protein
MDSRLTVADCRAALYKEVDATDVYSSEFLPKLNEVCERYMLSGKWKGMVVKLSLPASSGFVTLPRAFQNLLVHRYRGYPGPMFTQYHEFSVNGPGELREANAYSGQLVDAGDGFATQADIETPGTLRVIPGSSDDADKVIRVYGEDADGKEIFDADGLRGKNITLVLPSANTVQVFSKVTGIAAPQNIVAHWTLAVVNGSEVTEIGHYAPGETRPRYRRYKTGKTESAIEVLAQRRFVPAVAESDWVVPGNLTALRYGLQALRYEDAAQLQEAQAVFSRGLAFLNQEARLSRGGAQPTLNLRFFGVRGASFPATI